MAIKTTTSITEGRIGNVVFYQWNGKQCARIVPQRYNNPNTPAQQLQRAKMRKAQQWAQPLKDVLRLGFVEGSNGTYYTRAISSAMLHAMVSDGDDPHIDPTLALVAQGTLSPMLDGHIDPPVTHHPSPITIEWVPNEKSIRAHVDDRLVWVLYDEDKRNVITNAKRSPKPKRNSGTCLIDLSNAKAGTYHLYAFFVNAKGTQASDSVYLGEVTI